MKNGVIAFDNGKRNRDQRRRAERRAIRKNKRLPPRQLKALVREQSSPKV